MCFPIATFPDIAVHMTIDEARRVGDLNINIPKSEILRWRRKVRDAVHQYDADKAVGRQSQRGLLE